MKRVTKIDARPGALPRRMRVAAYARVSRDTERLEHSLSAQVSHYSELIQSNPAWEYAGVYADDGVTGTKAGARGEFQRMLADCEAGRVDLILTKSISRFARNTVDLLEAVRRLKAIGVGMRFEKEGIDTLSGDGEVMLTLLASFAQEEVTSLSSNVKWTLRKRMEQGVPSSRHPVYGYEWAGDRMVVGPEEADVVRRIFRDYLDGMSLAEIERGLNAEGMTTRAGNPWCSESIRRILANVTYAGDLLLQKVFTDDPITKRRKTNRGDLPQYLVEGHHEAIVDGETFRLVQEESARRRELGQLANKSLNTCCFTSRIRCPHRGVNYTHYRRTVSGRLRDSWVCSSKRHEKACDECPVYGSIAHGALANACAEALGLDEFDERAFLERVDHVEVPKAQTLDIFMRDGTVVRKATPGARRPSRRAEANAPKVASCLSSRIECADCGCAYRRDAHRNRGGGIRAYWRCPQGRACEPGGLREEELKGMCAEVLGTGEFDEGAFLERVDHIEARAGQGLEFHLADGTVASRGWPAARRRAAGKEKETPLGGRRGTEGEGR